MTTLFLREISFCETPRAILSLLLLAGLTMVCSAVCRAEETCPWLNSATAAGFLEGSVTSTVTHNNNDKSNKDKRNNDKNDATCEFIHRDGSTVSQLRIDVETMADPARAFPAYASRCRANSIPVKAIGNEAVACTIQGKKKQASEQIVGRVRDRAFLVRVTSNTDPTAPDALREKARRISEQVAGILF